jgi:hypothetical protein
MIPPSTRPKSRTVAHARPKFRSNKATVRYAGMRWHLIQDRGTWLLLERRGCTQFVHSALCR